MHYEYEIIEHITGLPLKAFLVSIGSRAYHWHSDLEIIWLLKGSVVLQLNTGDIMLNDGDVYLLNTNEVHCLKHTLNDNLLLALQINEDIVSSYFKRLRYIDFDAVQLMKNDDLLIRLKKKLAAILVGVVEGTPEQKMKTIGILHILLSDLFSEVPYRIIDKSTAKSKDDDLARLNRIIEYVNQHAQEKISLQQLADTEYISRYRMSHFIKEKLGISFQQLINKIRLENAMRLLVSKDDNILDISEACGFSDIKYLNRLLKDSFGMTARQLRMAELTTTSRSTVTEDNEHRQVNYQEAMRILRKYV